MTDPGTLYKLMILYMLKKVNFPLSNAQLWTFFESKGYTNYFTFQDTIAELLEANLISQDTVRSTVRYELTREGEDALYYFQDSITSGVKEDMDAFLKENKFQLRNETGIVADYYKTPNFDYTAHLEVREGKNVLFEININVPTEDQARVLTEHWEENAQQIYASVIRSLM